MTEEYLRREHEFSERTDSLCENNQSNHVVSHGITWYPTTTTSTTTSTSTTTAAAVTTNVDPAAAADRAIKALQGELGRGVVMLSDAQVRDLLDRLDIDAFDHYVSKLANFIIRNNAQVKNHYETILKWWNEDSQVREGRPTA